MKHFLALILTILISGSIIFGFGVWKYDGVKGFTNHIVENVDDLFSKEKDTETNKDNVDNSTSEQDSSSSVSSNSSSVDTSSHNFYVYGMRQSEGVCKFTVMDGSEVCDPGYVESFIVSESPNNLSDTNINGWFTVEKDGAVATITCNQSDWGSVGTVYILVVSDYTSPFLCTTGVPRDYFFSSSSGSGSTYVTGSSFSAN